MAGPSYPTARAALPSAASRRPSALPRPSAQTGGRPSALPTPRRTSRQPNQPNADRTTSTGQSIVREDDRVAPNADYPDGEPPLIERQAHPQTPSQHTPTRTSRLEANRASLRSSARGMPPVTTGAARGETRRATVGNGGATNAGVTNRLSTTGLSSIRLQGPAAKLPEGSPRRSSTSSATGRVAQHRPLVRGKAAAAQPASSPPLRRSVHPQSAPVPKLPQGSPTPSVRNGGGARTSLAMRSTSNTNKLRTPTAAREKDHDTRLESSRTRSNLPDRGDLGPTSGMTSAIPGVARTGLTPSKYTRRGSSGASTGLTTTSTATADTKVAATSTQGTHRLGQGKDRPPPSSPRRLSGASCVDSFRAARRASTGGQGDDENLISTPFEENTLQELAPSSLHSLSSTTVLRADGQEILPDRDEQTFGPSLGASARPLPRSTTSRDVTINPLQLSTSSTDVRGNVENEEPFQRVTNQTPNRRSSVTSSKRLSDRFNDANINTDNIEKLTSSVGRRRSRGISASGEFEYPKETPKPRRASVSLSRTLDLTPSSGSESPSTSSSSYSKSSQDASPFSRPLFPDRMQTAKSQQVDESTPLHPSTPLRASNDRTDISWVDEKSNQDDLF